MEIVALQVLNSLSYAAVLFLIAAGLSLIFGVMGIVNMAHGSFYALGAYVTAWSVGAAAAALPPAALFVFLLLGAIAVALVGLMIEPTLIRPFYRRQEEYQLLVTFGLLLVLEDVIRLLWGGTPLTASGLVDSLGLVRIGGLPYPVYNLLMIGVGAVAALALWAFCTAPSSACCCVPRRRTGAWLRRWGSTSGGSTSSPSVWAASWRGSAAPSSFRARRRCSAWEWKCWSSRSSWS